MENFVKGSRLEGQKFAVGDKIHVADEMPSWMSHFRAGEDATVLYTYGQAHGGNDSDAYFIMFEDGSTSGWYDEVQLTAVDDGFKDKLGGVATIIKDGMRDIVHTIRK